MTQPPGDPPPDPFDESLEDAVRRAIRETIRAAARRSALLDPRRPTFAEQLEELDGRLLVEEVEAFLRDEGEEDP